MAEVLIDVAKKFDVEGDDGKDYTEELLAACALAHKATRAGDASCVVLPSGDIRHSDTFLAKGTQSGAPFFRGSHGDGFNIRGTRLVWAGPTDGAQVYLECFNKGRFWDIAVDGQDKAGKNVVVGATKFDDPEAPGFGASGFSLQRLKLSRVRPGVEGNGSLAIGTSPALTGGQTRQASEWSIRDCVFMPESEGASGFNIANMKAFGFKTQSGGNVKNGELLNCDFQTCNKAIDWKDSSGFMNVKGFRMSNVRTAFEANSGHLNVEGGGIECGGVNDFRLLKGTMQIGAFASFRSVETSWNVAQGVEPILFEYCGSLELIQNYFKCKEGTPFVMKHGALAPNTWGSFYSRQNWYVGCGTTARPYVPLWDMSGNDLAPIVDTYGGVADLAVASHLDKGGTAGNPLRLLSFGSAAWR